MCEKPEPLAQMLPPILCPGCRDKPRHDHRCQRPVLICQCIEFECVMQTERTD